jgi:hypothetical protein
MMTVITSDISTIERIFASSLLSLSEVARSLSFLLHECPFWTPKKTRGFRKTSSFMTNMLLSAIRGKYTREPELISFYTKRMKSTVSSINAAIRFRSHGAYADVLSGKRSSSK